MIRKFIVFFVNVLSQKGMLQGQHAHYSVQQNRPNILFVMIDDLRADFGAYGNNIMHTPTLDSLANTGYLFTNQYANIPTCGASRYALLTGKLPRTEQELGNDIISQSFSSIQRRDSPESFIEQLKRSGYNTIGIGKISHSADGYVYPTITLMGSLQN